VRARTTLRRARPALGTLVEMGALVPEALLPEAESALAEGWRALGAAERALSAFDPGSDVGRFNAAAAGAELALSEEAALVLGAAAELFRESDGLFDVTLGTGPRDWALLGQGRGETRLRKRSASVRIDLGGIGKGHAVDRAFEALSRRLAEAPGEAACWVNAGGDLRAGAVDLPVYLRDERVGGARPWLLLREGALATSFFGGEARGRLAGAHRGGDRHVSVAAPRCLWSDALTKVVALSGEVDHPILSRHEAVAWLHPEPRP